MLALWQSFLFVAFSLSCKSLRLVTDDSYPLSLSSSSQSKPLAYSPSHSFSPLFTLRYLSPCVFNADVSQKADSSKHSGTTFLTNKHIAGEQQRTSFTTPNPPSPLPSPLPQNILPSTPPQPLLPPLPNTVDTSTNTANSITANTNTTSYNNTTTHAITPLPPPPASQKLTGCSTRRGRPPP